MNDKTATVSELKSLVEKFVSQRNWQQFHDPKNLAMSIAIEAAELMEHFQWARSDQVANYLSDPQQKDQVCQELADVLAFCLAMANVLEIDLADVLSKKMASNATKYPADKYLGRYKT